MWSAYFQADGEHRYTIAVTRFKHTAEFEAEKLTARMTNPEVGVWWVWVEETDEDCTVLRSDGGSAAGERVPERNDSQPAETDSGDGRKP
jgi:hypothetical protein